MNDVDPQAWLADVLARIATHPAHRLDELLPWNWKAAQQPRPRDAGGLMGHVNKVSHVFTLGHVAEMLGEDEEWLFEVAEEMDTEDGQLWVVGVGEDGVMAFTDDGIDTLENLIAIHKAEPSIIQKRRQTLAAMMKPKTEESGQV